MSHPDLQLARQIVERTHSHLFLTGKAGTGKTTFLRRLQDDCAKRMVVLAPTGIAAINAGGSTIHSFLQLPFGPYVPGLQPLGNSHKMSKRKIRLIASLDLIVIDEISMVRADLLDLMDHTLRRYRRSPLPFGGVQLLMIGDLQQLSPVVKESDWTLLAPHYSTPFFFSAQVFQQTSFVTVELQKVYRQSDQHFIDLLNQVRSGTADANSLKALNSRYIPDFIAPRSEGYVRLTTHNHQADQINQQELDALPSLPYSYTCYCQGNFPESAFPAPERLVLKIGAQVMFLKNDSTGQRRYFNGLLGEVIELENESVTVRTAEGETIKVVPEEWTNTRYQLNEKTKEIEEIVEGTFEQMPLRTAWAITIHKSQGLTFERAIIDASAAFAHGQTYVALSRCRSLEGLVLGAPLSAQSIIQDRSVQHFTAGIAAQMPTTTQVAEMERDYYAQLLRELFDFLPLRHALAAFLRLLEEKFYKALPAIVGDYRALFAAFQTEVEQVALRFRAQYEQLVAAPDYQHSPQLQDRVKRGAAYFYERLDSLHEQLRITAITSSNKELNERLQRLLQELKETLRSKREELNHVAESGFNMADYLRIRALAALGEAESSPQRRSRKKPSQQQEVKALIQAARASQQKPSTSQTPPEKTSKPPRQAGDSQQLSFQLFEQGFDIEEIAQQRNLQLSTIVRHLEPYVSSGQIELSELVPPTFIARLRAYRTEHPHSETPTSLTAIREAVGQDIEFWHIRLWLLAEG